MLSRPSRRTLLDFSEVTLEKKKASELFNQAFRDHCGSYWFTCACGVTYFTDDSSDMDWEPGELEGLREKATTQPDKYKAVDYTIETIEINGNRYSMDCDCGEAAYHEKFIVEHARQIAEYLNHRAINLRKLADDITVVKV